MSLFLVKSSSATSTVTVCAATAADALMVYDEFCATGRRLVATFDAEGAEVSREQLLDLLSANPSAVPSDASPDYSVKGH